MKQRQSDRQTDKLTNWQTEADRQTETNRQTDTQTSNILKIVLVFSIPDVLFKIRRMGLNAFGLDSFKTHLNLWLICKFVTAAAKSWF